MQFPRLRHNIIALGAHRGINYLIPIIVLPYLTRILGAHEFGKYALVQVVMQGFILLTDYGFSLTATRAVSANRANKQEVSRIFSVTWSAQWLLGGFSFLGILVLSLTVPVMKDHAFLYLGGFAMVLGNVLLPVWLLEGLEKMKAVAIIQVIGRSSMLPLLFILVKDSDDTFLAVIIMGGGLICAGLLSLAWIVYKRFIFWQKPDPADILRTIKKGFSLFASQLSQRMFYIITPFVLGVISGVEAVGYFNLADKLRGASQALLYPVSQALFPRMCHLYAHNKNEGDDLFKRSFLLIFGISVFVMVSLLVGSELIIDLFGGTQFKAAIPVLRLMAFIPLFSGFSLMFGVLVMLPNGMNRAYNLIVTSSSLLSVLTVAALVVWQGVNGAAIAAIMLESLIALQMGWFLHSKGFLEKLKGIY